MKKILFILTVSILAFSFLAAPIFAQTTATDGERVADIKVKGNESISTATILSRLKMRPGDVFEETALNKELKRLYATGYFADVFVETEKRPEGIVIVFTVIEKPIIDIVEFRGNKKIKSGRLSKDLAVKEGVLLDYNLVSQDVATIRTRYVDQGYSDVQVDYKVETDPQTGLVTLVFQINEGSELKIKTITFQGNEHIPANELEKYMSTKTAWWFLRKGAFDEDKFQSDLDRLRSVYRRKGFLDAQITSKVDIGEDGKYIYLTIIVDEGVLYLVGEMDLEGTLVFAEEEIRDQVKMKPGDPFDYGKMKEDVDNVRSLYFDKGYMNAEIDLKHKYNSASDRMDLTYTIEANEEVYVGKVNVIGNTKTKDKVIRREVRLYPGEMYDGQRLKKSKERIYNLGFFEDVYFDTVPTDDPNVKDLNVTVKETKTGELSFGGGYSSVDSFIGFAQVRQRNFDILNFPTFTGGGQDLTIRAELGSERQNYLLSWTDPWIFDFPYLFGFDVYREQRDRSSNSGYGYDETRTGGSLRLGKEITDEISTGLVYNLEEVDISNIEDNATDALRREVGKNWISRLTWNVAYDTRDNKYSPTKGWVTGTSLENAGSFLGGDKTFFKWWSYGSIYYSIMENVVAEGKLRGGFVQNYGDSDEVPIYERFFAGGARTIRGYKERGVGPRDKGTNTALGGEAMMIGNIEVTFPVYKKLIKGAVFFDIGNVWEEATLKELTGAKDDTGWKMGAGIGVRVKTPIGPVKLDWGYPLSDNYDDKKEGQFYFSVTHGF